MADWEESGYGAGLLSEDSIVKRIQENIIHPAEFCRRHREEDLKGSLKYYVKVVALSFLIQIFALFLLALIPQAHDDVLAEVVFGGLPPVLFVIGFVILCVPLFLVYLLYPFIDGLITHIGVLLAGGKQGLDKTFQAVIYYLVPYFILPSILIFCLVPAAICYNLLSLDFGQSDLLLILAFLILGTLYMWILIISIITVRELQCLSTLRAVFAALFPFILMFAVMLLFIGLLAGMMVVFPAVSQDSQPATGYQLPNVVYNVKSPLIPTVGELPESVTSIYANEMDQDSIKSLTEQFGVIRVYNIEYLAESPHSDHSRIISHDIIFLPPGRAAEMMTAEIASYQPDSSGYPKAQPCPNMGDESACFETLVTNIYARNEHPQYVLIFTKGDVLEKIVTLDGDPDFDLVTEIAALSAAKIPAQNPVIPFATQTTVTTPAPAGMTTVSFYDELRPGVDPASLQPGYYPGNAVTFLFTSADPAEVNIRLDYVERGTTPLMVTDVPIGSHTLYAYSEGYVPLHTFIYANSGRSFFERKIQLERNITG